MIFSISSENHRDKDEAWVVSLDHITELTPLIESPRSNIRQLEQDQAMSERLVAASDLKSIKFNRGLPIIFMISFRLGIEKYILQGVQGTNLVNVFVPEKKTRGDIKEDVEGFFPNIKEASNVRPLDIKLIQGYHPGIDNPLRLRSGIGYAHFDPEKPSGMNADNPVPDMVKLMEYPNAFCEWLNSSKRHHVKTYETVNGIRKSIRRDIKFEFPEKFRDVRFIYQQNHEGAPCFPQAPGGLCTKITGEYHHEEDGSELGVYTFVISEVAWVKYCEIDEEGNPLV